MAMATLALSSLSNLISSFLPSQSPPNPLSTFQPKSLSLPKTASEFVPPLVASSGRTLPSTSLSSSLMKADEITPIVCPSLAYSNILFHKSGYYNVEVVVGENEPEEKLMNRFRAAVFKSGVIQECRRRKFFESSQDKKKRKSRDAARRNRNRRPHPKASTQGKEQQPKRNDNSDDDNWELPEDLPY
ncbi:hypothetical protein SLA2020_047320 [Shorea laevis]